MFHSTTPIHWAILILHNCLRIGQMNIAHSWFSIVTFFFRIVDEHNYLIIFFHISLWIITVSVSMQQCFSIYCSQVVLCWWICLPTLPLHRPSMITRLSRRFPPYRPQNTMHAFPRYTCTFFQEHNYCFNDTNIHRFPASRGIVQDFPAMGGGGRFILWVYPSIVTLFSENMNATMT